MPFCDICHEYYYAATEHTCPSHWLCSLDPTEHRERWGKVLAHSAADAAECYAECYDYDCGEWPDERIVYVLDPRTASARVEAYRVAEQDMSDYCAEEYPYDGPQPPGDVCAQTMEDPCQS